MKQEVRLDATLYASPIEQSFGLLFDPFAITSKVPPAKCHQQSVTQPIMFKR
jgi:hypothetical protein